MRGHRAMLLVVVIALQACEGTQQPPSVPSCGECWNDDPWHQHFCAPGYCCDPAYRDPIRLSSFRCVPLADAAPCTVGDMLISFSDATACFR